MRARFVLFPLLPSSCEVPPRAVTVPALKRPKDRKHPTDDTRAFTVTPFELARRTTRGVSRRGPLQDTPRREEKTAEDEVP